MDNHEMMRKAAEAIAIDDMKKRNNKLRSLLRVLLYKETSVIPAQEDSEQLVSLALKQLAQGDGNAFTGLVMASAAKLPLPCNWTGLDKMKKLQVSCTRFPKLLRRLFRRLESSWREKCRITMTTWTCP